MRLPVAAKMALAMAAAAGATEHSPTPPHFGLPLSSLPPVSGNHDQLVQVFLNLVKNAAEAVPANVPIAAQQTAASNVCFMGELLSLSRRPNRKAV